MLRALAIVLVCVPLMESIAHAQTAGDASRTEARERFDRGLELFNERRFDAALAEFERAYAIAPAAPVLYNLARVHAALGHAVAASDAFERYLRDATDLTPQRRASVTQDLERQRARVARIVIVANVRGATVSLDGVDVATTPLAEPLRVTAGSHTVGVRAASYDSAQRAVTLAGNVSETMEFTLTQVVRRRGAVRVTSVLRDVEVRVDGHSVGRTPLGETLSLEPGNHLIEAERRGYQSLRRDVVLDDAAEVEVNVDLDVDPHAMADARGRLHLRTPAVPFTLAIDGRTAEAANDLDLPIGDHSLDVRAADRQPVQTRVSIEASNAAMLEPEFEWTPEARQSRVDAAASRRLVGWVGAGVSAAVMLTGGSLLAWNETRVDASVPATVSRCDVILAPAGCPPRPELEQMLADYNESVDSRNSMRVVFGVITGVGVAATAFFTVWALTSPTEDEIDSDARAQIVRMRLVAGPASLHLIGQF